MKNLILIIAAFIFTGSFATAQDLINLKSGKTLEVKITKIGKDKIEFRPFTAEKDDAVIEIDRYLVKSYSFEYENNVSEMAQIATEIKIEKLYDSTPRYAIKTQLVKAILFSNFVVSYETNLSYDKSIELEAGLQINPLLLDLVEIPTQFNLTGRYKNFSRRKSMKMTDNGANPLQGFYYAPVVSIGNSINYDRSEDLSRRIGTNLFASGMIDVGYQFTINKFIGEVFAGTGISLNSSNTEFSYNNTHGSYKIMAFRFGYRMGLQFEK